MKTAVVLGAVALATGLGVAPAHADVVWSGCDTDTFVKKVKKKGKVRLKVKQTATGCAERHVLSDGRTCRIVTAYNFAQTSKATTRKGVKTVTKWGPFRGLPEGKTFDNCSINGQTPLLTTDQDFTGEFTMKIKKKQFAASPRLYVRVDAETTDPEGIVTIENRGGWFFKAYSG
ncbi:MAG: hypothetical protein R2720_00270 [Candidatus Nanopelagicales bacterium]